MRCLLVIVAVALAAILGCSSKQEPTDQAKVHPDLETRRQKIEEQESKTSAEAVARKERSLALLKAEKVPFIAHLPVLETEAESKRRTTEAVANRAMALCIVAVKGEGLEQEIVDKLVKEYQLADQFSPAEAAFIKNPRPGEQERIQFAWRYECYWVMLWALGFLDKLERPDKICDVKQAVGTMQKLGRAGFLAKARLRPQAELLDAADLIYRYHWAVVSARLEKSPAPAGLDGGVVMERHHALNWLICYMNQEWDDVSTDT